MIFVNNAADYSANKIGEITLPTQISPQTNAILAKYSRVTSLEEKGILNKFVDFLLDKGIYSKLSLLALPYYAGTIAEALTNIAIENGESDYDASVHTNISKETYGIIVAVDSTNTITYPKTPYTDTAIKTCACAYYQKATGNNCAGNVGMDFFLGTNGYIIASYANAGMGFTPGVSMHTDVLGNAGATLQLANLYRIMDGRDLNPTLTGTAGTAIPTREKCQVGASVKPNGTAFCLHNGNLLIQLAFNECLPKADAILLDAALTEFANAIYAYNQ